MPTIEEILTELGIDISLDTPEKRKAIADAIKAILNAKNKSKIDKNEPKIDAEVDLEVDKDLKEPSKKDDNSSLDDYELEINDPDNLLNPDDDGDDSEEIGTDDVDNKSDNKDDNQESEANSEENSEDIDGENDSDNENSEEGDFDNLEDKDKNNSSSDNDQQDSSDIDDIYGYDFGADENDDSPEDQSDFENDETEEDDFDEENFKDDPLIDKPIDKNDPQEIKRRHRELSKNRVIKAAKHTINQIQKDSNNKSKIERLEKLVKELENITEDDLMNLSDEQFGNRINDILDIISELNKSVKVSSAEEHEIKVKEIKKELEDPETLRALEQEDNLNIGNEKRATKASEKEKAKYNNVGNFRTIADFKINFQRAIKNQVQDSENQERSWNVINRRYDGTNRVVKGLKNEKILDPLIPSIDIYVDCSGSWRDADIKVGEDILSYVAEYEAKGQIKINLYYFAVTLCSTKEEARAQSFTKAWPEILNNIKANKTKNVVLITDSDMSYQAYASPKCIVDGCVWIIWRNGIDSEHIVNKLVGKRGNYQYAFNSQRR